MNARGALVGLLVITALAGCGDGDDDAGGGDAPTTTSTPELPAATTIDVGDEPAAVAVGDGSVWVANPQEGTLLRIDPETTQITATIPVAGGVRGVATGDRTVWVTNPGAATVTGFAVGP